MSLELLLLITSCISCVNASGAISEPAEEVVGTEKVVGTSCILIWGFWCFTFAPLGGSLVRGLGFPNAVLIGGRMGYVSRFVRNVCSTSPLLLTSLMALGRNPSCVPHGTVNIFVSPLERLSVLGADKTTVSFSPVLLFIVKIDWG